MMRRSLLLAAGICGSSLAIGRSLRSLGARGPAAPAPSAFSAPAASLYGLRAPWLNDLGQGFQLSALAGKYVAVALIFTRCPNVCPVLIRQLRLAEERMPGSVLDAARFALFSIDPEHDTVAALRAYRKRMNLSDERWTLARAGLDTVRELGATLGFGFSAEVGGLPLHSKLITLLDRRGVPVLQRAELGTDPELIARTIHSALSQEGKRQP